MSGPHVVRGLGICADCVQVIANDEWTWLDATDWTEEEKQERVANIRAGLEREAAAGGHWVVESTEEEPGFSWSACDCCGETLGGERHDAAVVYHDPYGAKVRAWAAYENDPSDASREAYERAQEVCDAAAAEVTAAVQASRWAPGCYGDGALGHEHVRQRLADVVCDALGAGEWPQLAASLRGPMPDDGSDETEALDKLNEHTGLVWAFEGGDLMARTPEDAAAEGAE